MPAAARSRDRLSQRRAEAAVPSRETPRLRSATALNGRAALRDGARKEPGRPPGSRPGGTNGCVCWAPWKLYLPMKLVKSSGRGGSKLPLGSELFIATAKEAKGCFILRAGLDLTYFPPPRFSQCLGLSRERPPRGLLSRAPERCFIYKGDGILRPG